MTDEQRKGAIEWFKQRRQSALMPGANAMFRLALEALEQPKSDPVKHGKWVNTLGNYQVAECSECKNWYEVCDEEKPSKKMFDVFGQFYRYCPNCGARMDGEV